MARASIRADYLQYSSAATKPDRIGLVNQVSGGFGAGIDTLELIDLDAIREDL